MNPHIFYILVSIGILDIIVKLIPWGAIGNKKEHHDKHI